ncbi:DUF2947 domain-containing protein [Marinomonas balearica]|uniref:DUF2947 family protein n=1 Tax=Marinomonas balearica TaxID=491947 RepID=A0A4R6MDI6_9GAMM|nr:DUF2947 domain-containing protein [Marinomonas balearica]TDO99778.1 DUF2947 family protein [Marinomonas balearica]
MSNYIPLSSFPKSWVFNRRDPFVSEEDKQEIKWLSESSAADIWRDYVSADHLHPELLKESDWVVDSANEIGREAWEVRWESDDETLPEFILEHLGNWGEDTKVFYCCSNEIVFETTWGVFKRTWKAFLFLENGPVLIGRKKKQAVQFCTDGFARTLNRPV